MRGEQFLNKPAQYARVYENGKSWANRLFVVKASPNELGVARYGFSVGRRVGNAVVRNRVKRRLREIVRSLPLRAGWDIVVIARGAAGVASFTEGREAFLNLLLRAGVLISSNEEIVSGTN
ncbi:ribonuclease P protein component [Chloroflexota bacterium]